MKTKYSTKTHQQSLLRPAFLGSEATAFSLDSTRITFPSTSGSHSPNAMDATAPARGVKRKIRETERSLRNTAASEIAQFDWLRERRCSRQGQESTRFVIRARLCQLLLHYHRSFIAKTWQMCLTCLWLGHRHGARTKKQEYVRPLLTRHSGCQIVHEGTFAAHNRQPQHG